MPMFESDYSLAWALYGLAALGCLLFWFRVTRWMWRWLREPLRLIAAVLLFEMILVSIAVIQGGATAGLTAPGAPSADMTNVEAIGRVLYTDYVYFFQAAGIVLLIAMIGAITLTLRHKPHIKRQNISDQVNRSAAKAMEVKSVQTGQGVSPEELL